VTRRPPLLFAPAGLAGCGAAIAVGGTPPLGAAAWMSAGVVLALSLRPASAPSYSRLDELERHMARCRRRAQRAWVFVARVAAPRQLDPAKLLDCFRLTDSVSVARLPEGLEVAAVFDDDGLDRESVERRLRAVTAPVETRIAWRRFPDDGLTLQVLLDRARAALPGATGDEPAVMVLDGAHVPVEAP
jgi:hypothetical protein